MALRAARDSIIQIKASGEDAEAAVAALSRFGRHRFSGQRIVNERATIEACLSGQDGLDRLRAWAVCPRRWKDRVASVSLPRLADEEAALRAALVSAGQQIADLAEAVGGDSRANPRISGGAAGRRGLPRSDLCGRSSKGAPADAAWSSALDAQIADYNSAPDEYLAGARLRTWPTCAIACSNLLRGDGDSVQNSGWRSRLCRRSAAVAVPGNRLVARRRSGAVARQSDQSCRDAGPRARYPDGRAAWRPCRATAARAARRRGRHA